MWPEASSRRCRQFPFPDIAVNTGPDAVWGTELVLVPRVQNGEGKLLYRVDAALRDDGHKGHAARQQIVRGVHGLKPRLLDDLQNAFRATGLALDDEHLFRTVST